MEGEDATAMAILELRKPRRGVNEVRKGRMKDEDECKAARVPSEVLRGG